jgi:aspartyl-tRNA(Asn)/glutamyl-tRNA(Gln) amidotransferase subunit A
MKGDAAGPGLAASVAALAEGRVSSAILTADCLAAAQAPAGQGGVVFTRLYAEEARSAAAASDARRAAGRALSPIDGAPISIKDLFDVAGEATLAGARALEDEPPAAGDAEAVRRLKAAGAVIVGKTVMTQFALSGLGINPQFGTPLNAWGRGEGRIPGGSSSGAAVSVTDGMALGAIGTDTGGSVRVPAAFCGLVGFKPTANRISRQGVFALSHSLDSVGPICDSVAGCALLDQAMSGQGPGAPMGRALRLALPDRYVLDGLDDEVGAAFDAAIARLSDAGVEVVSIEMGVLADIPAINAAAGFSAIEGYATHAALFERVQARCDPLVMDRFLAARAVTAKDYFTALRLRERLIDESRLATRGFDAVVMPTAPLIAPTLASLADPVAYMTANGRSIRNAAVANVLDRCAISVPCQAFGAAPVGLMLMGETGADAELLKMAQGLERVIRGAPS